MSKRKSSGAPKRRNPYYGHPLMKKGGAHGKTRKAERRAARVQMQREWSVSSAAA
jgi:hypothetical protein